MATRLKTVEYYFPMVTSTITNNTLTPFTQITVHIPEASPSFKSVIVEVIAADMATAAGNFTTRNIQFRVGAAAYTPVTLTSTYTASAENIITMFNADFTSHMNTNWTGTSMTADCQVQINKSTGTITTTNNWTAKLTITYEYDDASATHVKTVWLPLNAPTGTLATSKPGTATAVIPSLDTWLPEDGKTIIQRTIVIQGNTRNGLNTTDLTFSMEIGTGGALTSGPYEGQLASDCWHRTTFQPAFATNASQNFFLWANVAKANHQQVFMVITYTFTPSSTTTVLNSVIMPMEFVSPMGSSTANFNRASRELMIQEPGAITKQESAFYLFWHQAASVTSVGVRVNGSGWTTHADAAAIMCGSNGLMFRCETPITLNRGRNTLTADVYRTSTTNLGTNVSSFWIINYTSGKATQGVGAHNHTVKWNVATTAGQTASSFRLTSAVGLVIPETHRYASAIGLHYQFITNSTNNPAGVTVQTEILSAEGGLAWENIYTAIAHDDSLTGIRHAFATARSVFRRWALDPDPSRVSIESSRRYRTYTATNTATYYSFDLLYTYHSITYEITGNVTGSSGGTVNLALHRAVTGEKVLTTSRTGSGAYTFVWYDDTENVYVVAEESTNVGRSLTGTA